MTRLNQLAASLLLCAGVAIAGCEKDDPDTGTSSIDKTSSGSGNVVTPVAGAKDGKKLLATVQLSAAPGDDNVKGTVTFTGAEHGVRVVARIEGLKPDSEHGFHIHEKGDLSDPKFTSAGPHFNPTGAKHGGPEGEARHGGDLGNLKTNADGVAEYDRVIHGISLDGEKDGIKGRSIIVHAKADDLSTDPSGDSGDRIGGGVIEAAAE